MPAQKPATSEQTVGTPPEFIEALEHRFGPLAWDLCASAENSVVPGGRYFDVATDGLKQDWGTIEGNLFCNPEFGQIKHWLAKAVDEASFQSRVFVLTPASLDANWWWKFCRPHAITYALKPRLQFIGHDKPYPKGLALHLFGMGAQGLGRWAWKETLEKARTEEPTDCRPPCETKTPAALGQIEADDEEDLAGKIEGRGKGRRKK